MAAALAFASLPGRASYAAWQNFRSSADGLADNFVYDIMEARDGALWFGTLSGASRFDGSRWLTVVDSLPNPRVTCLLEDSGGRLWFGTPDGLARFGPRWDRFGTATGELPADLMMAAVEDRHGDVWFGTPGGVVRHQPGPGTWTTYGAGTLIHPSAGQLLEDRRGNLWVGSPEGVSRLDSTRTAWTLFPRDPAGLAADSILAIAEDGRGRVWFGTDQGAFIYDGASWSRVGAVEGLVPPAVISLAADGGQGMWIGTTAGLAHYDGKTLRFRREASDGTPLGSIHCMRRDSNGNLWMATALQGVFRFDAVEWRHYFSNNTACPQPQAYSDIRREAVLASNCLTTMFRDHAGELWFGTANLGATRCARTGAWFSYNAATGRPVPNNVTVIAEDASHHLWLGSPANGVVEADSSRNIWTARRRLDGLAGDTVRTILGDAVGEVWIGTSNCLSRWNGGWTTYRPETGFDVQQIVEDGSGTLWMRTPGALWTLNPGRTVLEKVSAPIPYAGAGADPPTLMFRYGADGIVVGGKHGIAWRLNGSWLAKTTLTDEGDSIVTAMHVDGDGGLWVATSSSLSRFDGVQWQSMPMSEIGILGVHSLLKTTQGILWVVGSNGAANGTPGGTWRVVDNRSGLTADQSKGILEDTQGQIWFTSAAGVATHLPDRTAPQTTLVSTPTSIVPARTVAFAFGAAYGEFSDLEFSSRWDGEPFSDFSRSTTTSRSGLEDGIHTFDVVSRDRLLNADPIPARFSVEVDATPPTSEITALGPVVRGRIAIAGTASDARFQGFLLQARRAGATSWTGDDVVTLRQSTTPVEGDTLALWNTAAIADGNWELRLVVADTLGLVAIDRADIVVDNVAPFANVTTPARIIADVGGDVYTTNAEMHLYVPPGAFDRDATVTIDAEASTSSTALLSPSIVGSIWTLGWNPARLGKSAVLEMKPPSGFDGHALSISRRDPGRNWRPMGGTFDPSRGVLALPLSEPGDFALVESGAPGGSGSVSGITLTPRVFSTGGGYASSEVAIGFTLPQAGAVTVKVYNRAGRLMRMVSDHLSMGAGANLVRWDGRDRDGEMVTPGMYLVTVEFAGEERTQTLGVVR